MTHEEKIQWMAVWCAKNNLQLALSGEVGFWRECVGVLSGGSYPEYEWYDDKTYERIDNNGDVWIPDGHYHKGPYVAVLGRGEEAESRLYDWLRWFDENGFVLETGDQKVDPKLGAVAYLLGKHRYHRMVRKEQGK